jgi:hypothetical protein
MKHNELYKSIILQEAEETFPEIRKRTFSLEYYLDHFCELLNDVNKWKTLSKLKTIASTKKYHWKSIQNEFYRWDQHNVFVNAHNKFIRKYYFIMKPKLKKLGIKLYIDTTSIWNKYGIECIAVNPEFRKKNVTKLGTLVDDDGDIVSIINMIINSTNIFDNNDNFLYVKHTFDHDVKIMQTLFDNIIVNFDKRKTINCGGDKAFTTTEKIYHNNKEVKITTPKRKKSQKQIKKEI